MQLFGTESREPTVKNNQKKGGKSKKRPVEKLQQSGTRDIRNKKLNQ
jgi:hypothetical protein